MTTPSKSVSRCSVILTLIVVPSLYTGYPANVALGISKGQSVLLDKPVWTHFGVLIVVRPDPHKFFECVS